MAIASNEAPVRIRERSATASLSVGTEIRLRPRRAGCERTKVAAARQSARTMSSEGFRFMTNHVFPEGRLILLKQNTGINVRAGLGLVFPSSDGWVVLNCRRGL